MLHLLDQLRKRQASTPSVFLHLWLEEFDQPAPVAPIEEEVAPPSDLGEEGELFVGDEPEQEMEQNYAEPAHEPAGRPQAVTLQQIREHQITHPFLDLNLLAEAQAELEVFLDRNLGIYKNLRLYGDHLDYSFIYRFEGHALILVKVVLKKLAHWLLAILHAHKPQQLIYVEPQTEPRIQFKTTVMLLYRVGKTQHQQKEVLLAATPDMAYVFAEGFVISHLTKQFAFPLNQASLKEWILHVRSSVDYQTPDYAELLSLARAYFQQL